MSTLTLNTKPRLPRLKGLEFAFFAKLGAIAYPDNFDRVRASGKAYCTVFRRRRRGVAARAIRGLGV